MTKRQKEELAKYYLNVSLLSIGSLVFNSIAQSELIVKIGLSIGGLTIAFVFLILGLSLFKEVK